PVRRPASSATLAAAVLPVLALALAPASRAAEQVDRIFINGVVWTADPALPNAEALAVRQAIIVAVGLTKDLRNLAGQPADVVALKGRLVFPAFNDAHLHRFGGGLSLEEVDVAGSIGTAALQQRLQAYAQKHAERPWITGRGWGYGVLGTAPHRKILD